jgi:hypothetical protein
LENIELDGLAEILSLLAPKFLKNLLRVPAIFQNKFVVRVAHNLEL